METSTQLRLLQEIYRIYDDFIAGYHLACRRQCPLCCTRNLTMTTLEGALMVRFWESSNRKEWVEQVWRAAQEPRFIPTMTINQLADLCAQDVEIPEEETGLATAPCPLLESDLCSVYEARPFGCRAMVSEIDCALHHAAQMPPLVLTVNNLFLQYIEALDAQRFSGNLIDIVQLMANPLERQAYFRQGPMHPTRELLVNRPISVLMVPPEDRERIQPLIQALTQAQQKVV